ncbi:ATP-binding protein [Streptomyces sp. NPDC052727]|uniref:ATP-binding protein n=1 Tax=unclassified Streptomyces TaxID=2593676 RepID=UPI00341E6F5E
MHERRTPTPRTRQAFYRRDRRSVRLAREFAGQALADWATAERGDDVLLCVSELVTNALLHCVPAGRGFLLRLALHTDGVLRVEVHDKWGVGERNPGKIVWCEFAVRGEGVAVPGRLR